MVKSVTKENSKILRTRKATYRLSTLPAAHCSISSLYQRSLSNRPHVSGGQSHWTTRPSSSTTRPPEGTVIALLNPRPFPQLDARHLRRHPAVTPPRPAPVLPRARLDFHLHGLGILIVPFRLGIDLYGFTTVSRSPTRPSPLRTRRRHRGGRGHGVIEIHNPRCGPGEHMIQLEARRHGHRHPPRTSWTSSLSGSTVTCTGEPCVEGGDGSGAAHAPPVPGEVGLPAGLAVGLPQGNGVEGDLVRVADAKYALRARDAVLPPPRRWPRRRVQK